MEEVTQEAEAEDEGAEDEEAAEIEEVAEEQGALAVRAACCRCFSSLALAWFCLLVRNCTIWCGMRAFPIMAEGSPERLCTSVIVFL